MQCCRKRSSRGDRCWRNPALIAHVTQSEGIAACRAPMALISERLTPHSAKLSGLAPSQRGQVWVWPKSFVLSRRLCAQAKKPDRYWSAPWSAMSGGLNLRWVSLRPNRGEMHKAAPVGYSKRQRQRPILALLEVGATWTDPRPDARPRRLVCGGRGGASSVVHSTPPLQLMPLARQPSKFECRIVLRAPVRALTIRPTRWPAPAGPGG